MGVLLHMRRRMILVVTVASSVITVAQTSSTQATLTRQQELWSLCCDNKDAFETTSELASTYKQLDNYKSGQAVADARLKSGSSTADLLYIAAFFAFHGHDFDRSLNLCNAAYRLRPNDWRLHQLYALNFLELNLSSLTDQEFRRAVSLNPKDAELLYQQSRFLYSTGKDSEAEAAARSALALSPGYVEAYDSLGLILEAHGKIEEAVDAYGKAISMIREGHLKDGIPLMNYGVFLDQKLGRTAEAIQLLQESIAVDSTIARAHYELGLILNHKGDAAAAEKQMREAIRLDEHYTGAYWVLARLARQQGKLDESAALLNKFKSLQDAAQRKTGIDAITRN